MRIRTTRLPAPALALLAALGTAGAFRPFAAQDAKPDGNWKLVVLAFGDDDFAIVKLSPQNDKLTASVVTAQQMLLGQPQVKQVELIGDALTVALNSVIGQMTFHGKRVKDGANAGKFLGTVNFRSDLFPARLESTKETKVGQIGGSPMLKKYIDVMNDTDLQSKIKKLEELIAGNHGAPNNQLPYGALLGLAETAGLEPDRIGGLIDRWSEEAKPHGKEWVAEVRLKALKAIGRSKKFPKKAVELAAEADKRVSDGQLAPT
jgi:hypothetical protein